MQSTTNIPLLACQHISGGYADTQVVHDISLAVHAGEHVALIGPNGSGKSTLLHILSALLKPWQGTVQLNGANMHGIAPKMRAQSMAVISQKQEHLPAITVQDMVLLGRYPYLHWLGRYSQKDYAIAHAALEETGLAPLAQRLVCGLSGGEMQRVLLARALAQESRLFLLDELSAGLDVARMLDVFDLLDTRRKAGAGLLTVMHDLNIAALYADRIVAIKAGHILFSGTVREVFTASKLSMLFDVPLHVVPHPQRPVPQVCLDRTT
jgi:iron complex transport system ATP-binding protein